MGKVEKEENKSFLTEASKYRCRYIKLTEHFGCSDKLLAGAAVAVMSY